MGEHADKILARSFFRAQSKLLQREGFLEDALAAALEAPDFWPRLIEHLGWSDRLPAEVPTVSTQDACDGGRTDIRLTWSNGRELVLELKAGDPPSAAQIQTYLSNGFDIAAIARVPADILVTPVGEQHYFGVVPWSRIRELDWDGAPLPLHQLHGLINAMGLNMPKITRATLEGVVASWQVWNLLEEWTWSGTEAVPEVLSKGGFDCVWQEKKGQRIKIDMTNERLAWWIWPPPWNDDFAIYSGFFMGREWDPVLSPSLPDLVLCVHVQPDSKRGLALRSDPTWNNAAMKWANRQDATDVKREIRPDPGEWEIVRCRTSSALLADAHDPGNALIQWMKARATEWVEDGVIKFPAAVIAQSAKRK